LCPFVAKQVGSFFVFWGRSKKSDEKSARSQTKSSIFAARFHNKYFVRSPFVVKQADFFYFWGEE
jgi:hypothetical protein